MADLQAPAAILDVVGVSKRYGDALVVDDVSFSVPAGGSLAIVGESGSGKTTIAKMIVGLATPTSGSITACGHDRSTRSKSRDERLRRGGEIQIVFQDPYSSLDPRQSGRNAINEVLGLHVSAMSSSDRNRRVDELGALVGLDGRQLDALPRGLSGGQRQRIAIARALAAEPKLVILDESVAALDVSIQAQVLNVLADIREQTGVAYLLISHDLAVVRQITDDVVVLHRGRVVERGATAAVLDAPQEEYTKLLRSSVPRPGWRPRRRELSTLVASPGGQP